jgi:hypothetical protein
VERAGPRLRVDLAPGGSPSAWSRPPAPPRDAGPR